MRRRALGRSLDRRLASTNRRQSPHRQRADRPTQQRQPEKCTGAHQALRDGGTLLVPPLQVGPSWRPSRGTSIGGSQVGPSWRPSGGCSPPGGPQVGRPWRGGDLAEDLRRMGAEVGPCGGPAGGGLSQTGHEVGGSCEVCVCPLCDGPCVPLTRLDSYTGARSGARYGWHPASRHHSPANASGRTATGRLLAHPSPPYHTPPCRRVWRAACTMPHCTRTPRMMCRPTRYERGCTTRCIPPAASTYG